MGGSSAINAGLFFEPPASDFDLYFPEGWKAADMGPAIRRLYAMQPSTNITSQDGVRYLQSGYDPVRKWIVDGLGFENIDINGRADQKTEVFGFPIYDYDNGQRGGPVVSYLRAALLRNNFLLQVNTLVIRVEREGERATGVIVSIEDTEWLLRLSSQGRVILSAGAIRSPALLMFSGIGPVHFLRDLDTAGKLSPNLKREEWIRTNAVGGGLFDNPNTFIEVMGDSIESYSPSYDTPIEIQKNLYLNNRSGPYTFAGQTSVFWDTLSHNDGSTTTFQGTVGTSGSGNFTSNNTITLNIYGTSGLKSKGRVILDSNFIPGPDRDVYYSHPRDAKDIAGFIFKIFQALPDSGLIPLNLRQTSTLEEIEEYITTRTGQVSHWSSSCEIGKCVDMKTRVIGMQNLHVVDASIIAPLSVNPQFGIMAAAERASELILGL